MRPTDSDFLLSFQPNVHTSMANHPAIQNTQHTSTTFRKLSVQNFDKSEPYILAIRANNRLSTAGQYITQTAGHLRHFVERASVGYWIERRSISGRVYFEDASVTCLLNVSLAHMAFCTFPADAAAFPVVMPSGLQRRNGAHVEYKIACRNASYCSPTKFFRGPYETAVQRTNEFRHTFGLWMRRTRAK